MKKLLILLLLPLMVSHAQAQTSVWKISKNSNELYLAGSIHVLKESDYPLPEEFDLAFENAEKLVFEADVSQLNNPQMAQVIMQNAMLEDNKTLQDVLNEEVYKALEAEANKMSMPLASLSRFKPGMVVVTMTGIKLQQLGITATGVDQHFIDKANEAEKELGYLETIEEQLEIIMNMGKGKENEFVMYSIEDMESMSTEMDKLVKSWREGTSELMTEQLTEMEAEYPELYQRIMVDRNNNWMPQIETFLSDKSVEFVVVGSLHLHGEDGLLQQLVAKGYKIQQLGL